MLPPISVPITANTTGLNVALAGVDARIHAIAASASLVGVSISSWGARLDLIGNKMLVLGGRMSVVLSAPILLLEKGSVTAFSNFNKAMTESLAIAQDVTKAQRKEAEDTAKSLSTKLAFSADSLAKGYYPLISSGMDVAQSIKALKPAAEFAQAGVFDLDTAVQLLVGAQSALGMKSADASQNMVNMTRVSDVLNKVNIMSLGTVRDYATAMTTAAPIGHAYGQSLEEITSVLGVLGAKGILAEEGGMAYSMILRYLTVAAVKAAPAFKQWGISVYDATGQLRPMAEIVGAMEKTFAGMGTSQIVSLFQQLKISTKGLTPLIALIGSSGELRNMKEGLFETGVTTRIAGELMKSFANQMMLVKNKIHLCAIEIGEILAPYVEMIGNKIVTLTEWFTHLSKETQISYLKFATYTAIFAPLLFGLGFLVKVVGEAAIAMVWMGRTAKIIGVKLFGLGTTVKATAASQVALAASTNTATAAIIAQGTAAKTTATSLNSLSLANLGSGFASTEVPATAAGVGIMKARLSKQAVYQGESAAYKATSTATKEIAKGTVEVGGFVLAWKVITSVLKGVLSFIKNIVLGIGKIGLAIATPIAAVLLLMSIFAYDPTKGFLANIKDLMSGAIWAFKEIGGAFWHLISSMTKLIGTLGKFVLTAGGLIHWEKILPDPIIVKESMKTIVGIISDSVNEIGNILDKMAGFVLHFPENKKNFKVKMQNWVKDLVWGPGAGYREDTDSFNLSTKSYKPSTEAKTAVSNVLNGIASGLSGIILHHASQGNTIYDSKGSIIPPGTANGRTMYNDKGIMTKIPGGFSTTTYSNEAIAKALNTGWKGLQSAWEKGKVGIITGGIASLLGVPATQAVGMGILGQGIANLMPKVVQGTQEALGIPQLATEMGPTTQKAPAMLRGTTEAYSAYYSGGRQESQDYARKTADYTRDTANYLKPDGDLQGLLKDIKTGVTGGEVIDEGAFNGA